MIQSVPDDPHSEQKQNESIEIQLLLEAIYLKYGYDFRNYACASIKRRIVRKMDLENIPTLADMQHRLLYDLDFFETLLMDLSINVTEMFRDPSFYKALREKVLPALQGTPFIKIWIAGCATGEEAYSVAVILQETGLYDACRVYATDFNEKALQQAKEGIYTAETIRQSTHNYKLAGGAASFTDYYTARYDNAIIDQSLKKNVVFSDHNLVTDSDFGEMNIIICRNVLIYFNRTLQDRVFQLFHTSLPPGGFLCLGSKESIGLSEYADRFDHIIPREKIYRKK